MKQKWPLGRAAIYGGIVGLVISIAGPLVSGGGLPSDTGGLIGNLGIGIVIGAVVGVVIALIRNATIKAA